MKKLNLNEGEICELYLNKEITPLELSKKLGCNYQVIYKILIKNNIKIHSFKGKSKLRRIFSETQKNNIISLYKYQLLSRDEIARIYHCGFKLVSNILKERKEMMNRSERRKLLLSQGKIKIWNDGLDMNDNRVRINILKSKEWKNNNYKGKTWEEFYGEAKAKDMKERRINKLIGQKRTLEQKQIMRLAPNKGRFKIGHISPNKGLILGSNKKLSETKKRLYAEGKIVPARKNKTHTLEAINKIKEARAKQILPIKDTKIEVKIRKFLDTLQIEYFQHKHININHAYQCDFFIPSKNLVIECDGDYWHKYPTGRDIDHIRTSELLEKGFKVLRLWEFEIKKMDINKFQEKMS